MGFAWAFLLVVACIVINWLTVGLVFKLVPRSTLRLAGANLLIGVGAYLSELRMVYENWWVWNFSDLLVLLGLIFYRNALNIFVFERYSRRESVITFLVFGAGYVLIPAQTENVRFFILMFTGGALYLSVRMALDIHRWHQIDTPHKSVWTFSWPFWAITVMFSTASLYNVINWNTPFEFRPLMQQPITWSYAIYILLVNSFIAVIAIFRLMQQVKYLADHDSLTGTLNHRCFKETLEKQLVPLKGEQIGIIYFDLDNFKKINDTYGHSVGDQALIHATKIVQSQMDADELIGRLGGEEFAILLTSCEPSEVRQLAERLCKRLESSPLVIQGESLTLTASFGVACAPSTLPSARLMDMADHASYEAKRRGKNQVVVADLGG